MTIKGKERRELGLGRWLRRWLCGGAATAVLLAAAFGGAAGMDAAGAQDVAPETPPELRDFRLDPEKPKSAPGPSAGPSAEPIIEPPNIAPSPGSAPVRVPVRAPVIRTPASRTPAVAAPVREIPAAAAPAPEVSPEVTAPAPTAAQQSAPQAMPDAAIADAPRDGAEPGEGEPGGDLWTPLWTQWKWLLAALIGVFSAALLAFILYRRRAPRVDAAAEGDAVPVIPLEPAEDERTAHVMPVTPDPMPAPPAPAAAPNRPQLDISFVPAKASISLTNLTITGQLRIVNAGGGDAGAMQLNAAIISANEAQEEMIAAYFSGDAGPGQEPGKELGTAKAGERIALDLDLMIPLSELRTFGFGTQKLLVPIVLARVTYQWGAADAMQSDEARLSCLIGREATPPTAKMGALRLDKGPRSFASIGQRPVFG
jgi:hypothetical protein